MEIIDRSVWGAREDDGFRDRALPVNEVWLHHSVTIAPDLIPPFDDDYAAVRTLENIGESRFGGGISYTFPITPAGLIFEGHSVWRSGAHTLNRNDIAAAICWIGNYAVNDPPEPMIRATAWLLVHGKRQGWWRQARLSGGHGQAPGQATDCPGSKARAAIARVNELASQYEAGLIDLEDDDMLNNEIVNVVRPDTGETWPENAAIVLGYLMGTVNFLRDSAIAQSEVLRQIAENDDRIQLTDEQLGKLSVSVSTDLRAVVEDGIVQLGNFLVDKLGVTEDTVRNALRDFYGVAVDAA